MWAHFYKGFAIEDDGIFSDDLPYSVQYNGDENLFATIEEAQAFIDEIAGGLEAKENEMINHLYEMADDEFVNLWNKYSDREISFSDNYLYKFHPMSELKKYRSVTEVTMDDDFDTTKPYFWAEQWNNGKHITAVVDPAKFVSIDDLAWLADYLIENK